MDFEFNAEEWSGLTPVERAQRCRLLSRQTHRLAEKAPEELKSIYEHLADQWEKLASEIERHRSEDGL